MRGFVTLAVCVALLVLAGIALSVGLLHPEWLMEAEGLIWV